MFPDPSYVPEAETAFERATPDAIDEWFRQNGGVYQTFQEEGWYELPGDAHTPASAVLIVYVGRGGSEC